MPTKFSTSNRTLSDTQGGSEPQFPIYFCEVCGFKGAGFHVKRADGQLSYCGWDGSHPVCVGKGKDGVQVVAKPPSAPWE